MNQVKGGRYQAKELAYYEKQQGIGTGSAWFIVNREKFFWQSYL